MYLIHTNQLGQLKRLYNDFICKQICLSRRRVTTTMVKVRVRGAKGQEGVGMVSQMEGVL